VRTVPILVVVGALTSLNLELPGQRDDKAGEDGEAGPKMGTRESTSPASKRNNSTKRDL
jgi:hypothetical protein